MENVESAGEIIGRHKYEWLKGFKELDDEQQKQVEEFEAKNQIISKPMPVKEKIQLIPGIPLTKKTLWKAFLIAFKANTGKEFLQTPETIQNIAPIIDYFTKEESFFERSSLIKEIEGVKLEPSFKKGLLLVGTYGNGKTSIMTSIEAAIKWMYKEAIDNNWDTKHQWSSIKFNGYKTHDIVTEYETLPNVEARTNFYKKYKGYRIYIDDLKKEKKASNFGTTEIIREIFEKRYDGDSITYGSCNFKENSQSVEAALDEFGERYGGHIYDRLFLMYNIIVFGGKSFRK